MRYFVDVKPAFVNTKKLVSDYNINIHSTYKLS